MCASYWFSPGLLLVASNLLVLDVFWAFCCLMLSAVRWLIFDAWWFWLIVCWQLFGCCMSLYLLFLAVSCCFMSFDFGAFRFVSGVLCGCLVLTSGSLGVSVPVTFTSSSTHPHGTTPPWANPEWPETQPNDEGIKTNLTFLVEFWSPFWIHFISLVLLGEVWRTWHWNPWRTNHDFSGNALMS